MLDERMSDHVADVLKIARGAKRLRRLADYLESIKNQRFDMHAWVDIKDEKLYKLPKKEFKNKVMEGSCGTTACAFGHAAMIPEFQRLGLGYIFDETNTNITVGFKPKGADERVTGFDAAEEFFSIDYCTACYLFDPEDYPEGRRGRSYVIKRLRSVAGKMERKIKHDVREIHEELRELNSVVNQLEAPI